jgi:putative ABC transport system permease protein
MKTYDMVELAGRNLRESVLRNSLTTVGIAVGVASLVAMLSLGIGLQQLANRRLTNSGLFNSVVVTSRDLDRMRPSERRQAEQMSSVRYRAVDEQARKEIAALPHVTEVFPEIRFMADARYGDKSQFLPIAGVPSSQADRDAFENLDGTFFTSPTADEVIVQTDAAKEYAPNPHDLIGKTITVRYAQRQAGNQPAATTEAQQDQRDQQAADEMVTSGFSVVRKTKELKVVGIVDVDPEAALRSFARARLFIPVKVAETLDVMQGSELREMVRSTTTGATYLALTVRVDTPGGVQQVEDSIKHMGLGAFSLLDATRSLRRFFTILDMFLGIFGSLALAVASLGIINTLVMAILERRREIGIMKAIGASDSDVKRLFFAEAGVMGLFGGVVGVVLGWLIGHAINFGTNVYLQRQDMRPETFWSVPWWLVAAALGFSIAVSLGSGLLPAARAAKLDPVQALRYE